MVVVTLTGTWAAATSRATAGVKYGAGRPRVARVGYQIWIISSRWREGSNTAMAMVPTCSGPVAGGTASLGGGLAAGRAAVGLLVVAWAVAVVVHDAAQRTASALTASPAGRSSFIILFPASVMPVTPARHPR